MSPLPLLAVVAIGARRRLPGRVTRVEGGALLVAFVAYTFLLVSTAGS